MAEGRSYKLTLLQPEESVAFSGGGHAGPFGGGWRGVYKWCQQNKNSPWVKVSANPLFAFHDFLIVHLDADVAEEDPARDTLSPIPDLAGILPCHQPCPPSYHTTNRLREVVINWLGENSLPPRTVLCTPSKNTEAWVVAAFIPDDKIMERKGWECYGQLENRLSQLPLKQRFKKTAEHYRARKLHIKQYWPDVIKRMTEAKRFQDEISALINRA